ncbi:caspase-8-like [Ptychodera flava]|uniref:caspase-8-like n=1 Tax=Ptychodera flava TaxID=63121 RepID=UPI00396AAEC8
MDRKDFKYRKILKSVDENLVARDLDMLKFLCQDFIADGKLEKAKKPRDVFQELEFKGYIGPGENLYFLADILQKIHRMDLIKKLELGNTKDVLAKLAVIYRHKSMFSKFRLLLLEICNSLTNEDFESMKYECQSMISKGRLEQIKHPAMLLSSLQQNDHICEGDVSFLEELMDSIGNSEMLRKVQQYKASIIKSDDAPGVPRDLQNYHENLPVQPSEYRQQHKLLPPAHFQLPAEQRQEQLYPGTVAAQPGQMQAPPQWQQAQVHGPQIPQEGFIEPVMERTGTEGSSDLQNQGTITETVCQDEMPHYKMDTNPLGICVIINNENFSYDPTIPNCKDLKRREGSSIDRDKLRDLFTKFRFIVKVEENLTAADMLRYLEDVGKEDHRPYSCLVCCILSHGVQDNVFGSDGVKVEISDLTGCFKGIRCPGLVGKPKLFFLQACQGTDHQRGDLEADSAPSVPNEADVLLAYATVPGFVSYRSTSQGSWFITTLVDCLKEYHAREDLLSIMVKVNQRIAEGEAEMRVDGRFGIYKQVPAPLVTLRKKVRFPPTTF